MKYDDASWHSGGDFPAELSDEAGATHTGMFLAWAISRGLASDEHISDFDGDIARLKSRQINPGRYFLLLDGKLSDSDLNEQGNAFAEVYYNSEPSPFFADYEECCGADLPTLYHVPDSWESFDKIAPRLDQRFAEWQSKAAKKGSRVRALERRARANELEVEHILKLVVDGTSEDAAALRGLAARHPRLRDEPFASWVAVVCAFLERGYAGVVTHAASESAVPFATSVLASLLTADSVRTLLDLSRKFDALDVHCKITSALNLVLSFKSAPVLADTLAVDVRDFLHRVLERGQDDKQRAGAIYALRGVGDLDSIERIQRLPALADPWLEAPRQAVAAIRRRLARGISHD